MSRDEIRKRELARRLEGRELYSDEAGEPIFRRSVTAYLDILGTKESMPTMTSAGLRLQLDLLDEHLSALHDQPDDVQWQRMLTFSDCIALAVPVSETLPPGGNLEMVIESIATYQFLQAREGRFLRGGITLGDAYADYSTITGKALVDAVVLEENIAVVPRVLVSSDCLEHLIEAIRESHGNRWAMATETSTRLLIDADGLGFVNYLYVALDAEGNEVQPAVELLRKHRDAVVRALDKYPGSSRIRDKYVWVAHYHNAFCEEHRPGFDLQIVDRLSPLEARYPREFRPLITR